MLTVLVVSPPDPELDALSGALPSIEVLHAHGAEDALEKLGRNRRIDAILLARLSAASAAAILREIREDNPAPPPVFAADSVEGGIARGARPLAGDGFRALLQALERALLAESEAES